MIIDVMPKAGAYVLVLALGGIPLAAAIPVAILFRRRKHIFWAMLPGIAIPLALLVGTLYLMSVGRIIIMDNAVTVHAFLTIREIQITNIRNVERLGQPPTLLRTNGIAVGDYMAGKFRSSDHPWIVLTNGDSEVTFSDGHTYYRLSTGAQTDSFLRAISHYAE